MRLFLLACCTVAAAASARAQAVGEDLAARLAPARQRCAGADAPPVAGHVQLDEAARQAARGEPVMAAAMQAGYRATRAVHIRLRGYGNASSAAAFVGQQYCDLLADAQLRGVGAWREGSSWSIVVAAPLVPPAAADAGAVAARVLQLVNEARSQPRDCGQRRFGPAPALRPNAVLDRAAAAHSQDMARHGTLAHKGHDGSEVGERASREGYAWRTIGENVAAGQAGPEEVVRDWLGSPGHCANIMEPAFTDMGLAWAANLATRGGVYWTQVFGRPITMRP